MIGRLEYAEIPQSSSIISGSSDRPLSPSLQPSGLLLSVSPLKTQKRNIMNCFPHEPLLRLMKR